MYEETIRIACNWSHKLRKGGTDTRHKSLSRSNKTHHFCKNTTKTPDINRRGIKFATQQDFRCSVPQSHNFMSVCAHRHAKCTSQPKVCQFDVTSSIYQKVLWLQIPVQYTMQVAISHTLQQLVQVALQTQSQLLRCPTDKNSCFL